MRQVILAQIDFIPYAIGWLMVGEWLMYPLLLAFSLALVFSILLYLIGCMVAPKTEETIGKLAPYACGEEYPTRKIRVNAERFFLYLTFFAIFDISAFMLAVSFSNLGFYPVIFGAIILIAAVTVLPIWRGT